MVLRGSAGTNEPNRKRGRGPAKDTPFERIRKFGKIQLTIEDGQRGLSCQNYKKFSEQVTIIVRFHTNLQHASWKTVPKEEKEELIDCVRVRHLIA